MQVIYTTTITVTRTVNSDGVKIRVIVSSPMELSSAVRCVRIFATNLLLQLLLLVHHNYYSQVISLWK